MSTPDWACFLGAKGSLKIFANLIWVLILSYARSSWKGTIQDKPGKDHEVKAGLGSHNLHIRS